MSPKQLRMYYGYWRDAKKALLADGKTTDETEVIRKRIHFQRGAFFVINGNVVVRSSKHLTNTQIDHVLKDFRAISHGDDLAYQLEQLNQPAKRILYATAALLDQILLDEQGRAVRDDDARERYLSGIIKKPLYEATERDLQTCIIACTRTAKYKKPAEAEVDAPF